MKNRNKKVLFALMLGCSITLMATGCDKLKKEPETETELSRIPLEVAMPSLAPETVPVMEMLLT